MGLGFRQLAKFNMALLAKQGWRLMCNPNSLVSCVLKAKYCANTYFMSSRLRGQPSVIWRSICSAKAFLFKDSCW